MNIKDRIRILRKSIKLSQPEFAKRISISNAYISQLETGDRDINDRMIQLICQEFNVNEDWLRTGEGEMYKVETEFIDVIMSNLDDIDDLDKQIIMEYIKLGDNERAVIKKWLKNTFGEKG